MTTMMTKYHLNKNRFKFILRGKKPHKQKTVNGDFLKHTYNNHVK